MKRPKGNLQGTRVNRPGINPGRVTKKPVRCKAAGHFTNGKGKPIFVDVNGLIPPGYTRVKVNTKGDKRHVRSKKKK